MYNQSLRSKVFIPIHLDVLAVPSSSPEWRIGWIAQNKVMGIPESEQPEARWLVDPIDYLKPQVYSPDDARWSDPDKANAMEQYCAGGD
jgi:hypothetical protein